MDEVHRERIERLAEETDGTPDPGFDKVQQVADSVHQQYEGEIPSGSDQANPNEQVPQDGQLDRPVGTETDSY